MTLINSKNYNKLKSEKAKSYPNCGCTIEIPIEFKNKTEF